MGSSNFIVKALNPMGIGIKGKSIEDRFQMTLSGDTANVFGSARKPKNPFRHKKDMFGLMPQEENVDYTIDSDQTYGEIDAVNRDNQAKALKDKLARKTRTIFSNGILGTNKNNGQTTLGSNV